MISCAAYSSELMLMSLGLFSMVMYWMVRARTPMGHSRYHQNWAWGLYPPLVERLESLRATPKGTGGIWYAMGHEIGERGEDRALLSTAGPCGGQTLCGGGLGSRVSNVR